MIKPGGRFQKADIAFLHQIRLGKAEAAELAGHRDHQPQMRHCDIVARIAVVLHPPAGGKLGFLFA